ncbi:MAG: Stp1/IreP family PP2C-type Ser/Thr phosphatase, partial [Nitriliruptoraceae bacterium]
MTRLVATGTTDVGRVRSSNEDAYFVGDSVFAVADGMGGHAAGEVAASTALEPIRALDGRVFGDATEALAALRDAVITANATVSRMAEDDPTYHGMGTTLTATLLEGARLHIAHVGDSRAYLLRDGKFSQITDDHTLVQHLIDEGQITREEAANHPQRSIITRAIGVSPEVDVDSMSLELQPDDILLLCSDGLTGVVDDRTIATTLAQRDDPDTTIETLVSLANDAGGPDNVTAVLLRYEDAAAARGTNGPTTVAIRTRHDDPGADWARKMGTFGAFG